MNFLPRRASLAVLAGSALLTTGAALAFAVPGAAAQPLAPPQGHSGSPAPAGDNGDIKVHRSTTPVTDPRNEPHVCVFYLDAFNFDPGQSVSWNIKSWPPTGDRTVVASGVQVLDSSGDGHTADMTLPNGHYKLFWTFAGEHGFAKQKVFWVACPAATTPPAPTTPPVTTPPVPTVTPQPTAPASPGPVPPAPAPTPVSGDLPVTG